MPKKVKEVVEIHEEHAEDIKEVEEVEDDKEETPELKRDDINVKPKRKLTEKQLENLKAGRLKAIERRKQLSEEMDLKNRTKILKEEKEKKYKNDMNKAKEEYEEAVKGVVEEPKTKQKKKKKVVYVDDDESSDEEIVYVKKNKKITKDKDEQSVSNLVQKSSTELLREKLMNDQLEQMKNLLRPY